MNDPNDDVPPDIKNAGKCTSIVRHERVVNALKVLVFVSLNNRGWLLKTPPWASLRLFVAAELSDLLSTGHKAQTN
ncbi:hypothetical protein Zmor_021401 [Zophobas morio]|uniref:Uncharacterized protein n=1 Tax=Zophobas morio TaxID=2755281 RepID=A0AA38MAZ4_9CUCU|nr:hypothetical protein Zmor_021401 [Zophobas morio]